MNELRIIATIAVKPEYQKDILTAMHNVVDATRKEEGNILYELHVNTSNELEYTIFEVWKSQEAIDLHNSSVHFNEFKQAIDGKIASLKVDIIKKVY